METLVAIAFTIVLVYVVYKFVSAKEPIDANQDGVVSKEEAVAAAEKVATEIKEEVTEVVKKVRKPRAKKTDAQ